MKKNTLRVHPEQDSRRLEDEYAVRGYQEVADEFYRRTGQRISRAAVWMHLANAHRKIAERLKDLARR